MILLQHHDENIHLPTRNNLPEIKNRLSENKKSVSKLIQIYVDKALLMQEEENLERVYQAWDEIEGIVKTSDHNLASSVDEVLYGKQLTKKNQPNIIAFWKSPFHRK